MDTRKGQTLVWLQKTFKRHPWSSVRVEDWSIFKYILYLFFYLIYISKSYLTYDDPIMVWRYDLMHMVWRYDLMHAKIKLNLIWRFLKILPHTCFVKLCVHETIKIQQWYQSYIICMRFRFRFKICREKF